MGIMFVGFDIFEMCFFPKGLPHIFYRGSYLQGHAILSLLWQGCVVNHKYFHEQSAIRCIFSSATVDLLRIQKTLKIMVIF